MKYVLLLVMILCSLAGYPETFSIDKPGTLNQILKKQGVKEYRTLKIVGTINLSDLNYLKKLSSLEELDLRDAEFQEFKNNKDKYKFPKLSTLKTLRISSKFADHKTFDIRELGDIRNIETPSTNKFLGLTTNLIDSLIINDNAPISRSQPIIYAPVTIKYLSTTNNNPYDPIKKPINIDILVYRNARGSQAIHITDDYINLLNHCNEINSNCNWDISYNSIDLSNIETLGANAFKGSPIKEIYLSSSIKKIDTNAFNNSNIKLIEFTEPLIDKNIAFNIPLDITVIIPDGTYKTLSSIIKTPIFEKGKPNKQHIIVTEDTPMAELLSSEALYRLDTLSIEGTVTLSDLQMLKDARNLRVLDLSKCNVIKEQESLYQEKRKLALKLIKDLWTETLNNIYKIRDERAEEQMSYALIGYIAGVSKDKSKKEYEYGNTLAIFDHYMAKSLEEEAKANYQALEGISHKERDAMNNFMDYYKGVLNITGINENLLEYMPKYIPNPDYGGKSIPVKEETVIERCKELASLFRVPEPDFSNSNDNRHFIYFINDYDPIYDWQRQSLGNGQVKYTKTSSKYPNTKSVGWRGLSFMKLRGDVKTIEQIPLNLDTFSFIPSLNRIIL